MESRCIICGKTFEAKNAKGVLCSPACRSRNHRKIKKEKLFSLSNGSNFSNPPISVNQIQLNYMAINNYCVENNCTWVDLIECHKIVNKKVFDAPKIELKNDEFRVPPQPTKRYTILEYNQRIFDATGFEQDLKQVENDIRNDKFLTTQQRLILLRSMGLSE